MGRRVNKKKNQKAMLNIFRKGDDSTNKFEKLVLGAIALVITFIIVSTVSGISALMKVGSKSMISSIDVSSNEPVNILLLGMDIGDPKQADIGCTHDLFVLLFRVANAATIFGIERKA